GDNSKCPDRRERAAVLAVELVCAITVVQHNLALEAAWQIEGSHERVSRIPIAVSIKARLAAVLVAIALVVVPSRVVDVVVVTRVAVTLTWIEAVVEHTPLPFGNRSTRSKKRLRGVGPADVRV